MRKTVLPEQPDPPVVYVRKHKHKVTLTFASDMLKRNTDSVKCAVENDVFRLLTDDSLLKEPEV